MVVVADFGGHGASASSSHARWRNADPADGIPWADRWDRIAKQIVSKAVSVIFVPVRTNDLRVTHRVLSDAVGKDHAGLLQCDAMSDSAEFMQRITKLTSDCYERALADI
jgi:hypothetical protein